jgi:hypothetical protein
MQYTKASNLKTNIIGTADFAKMRKSAGREKYSSILSSISSAAVKPTFDAPALFADNARREGSARITELDAPFGEGLARLVQGKACRGEATAAQGVVPIMR